MLTRNGVGVTPYSSCSLPITGGLQDLFLPKNHVLITYSLYPILTDESVGGQPTKTKLVCYNQILRIGGKLRDSPFCKLPYIICSFRRKISSHTMINTTQVQLLRFILRLLPFQVRSIRIRTIYYLFNIIKEHFFKSW